MPVRADRPAWTQQCGDGTMPGRARASSMYVAGREAPTNFVSGRQWVLSPATLRSKLSAAVWTASHGLQTVALSVRAGHFEYESVVGVCKIASERMWQFESAPAHHPPSFWRGLRRVICIRNLVLGTGFSCFQSPGCQAPRRLQSCGKEAEKTVKTVGFFENRRYKIPGPSAGFRAPTRGGSQSPG